MKHLNLKLEKLEQRIAPTNLVMLGDAGAGSYASPGGDVFSNVDDADQNDHDDHNQDDHDDASPDDHDDHDQDDHDDGSKDDASKGGS